MLVMAMASRKGGSGKTTLAGHLAVQAERAGAGPIALVDTDPQGSLSDWWNEREAETPVFARTIISQLPQDIERMQRLGIKLLIVDTPPAITLTIAHVIKQADLVVIPTRPSPHDLRAAGATIELVERMGKSMVFVINGATPRARITSEAAIALSQHGTLAPSIIHQRTDFAGSMIDGRTVMELPRKSRSAEEIERLWEYLDNRLGRDDAVSNVVEAQRLPPPDPAYGIRSVVGEVLT
ncbi:MAG: AAA family ATPase [Alphaproteobacteria bacterium]|nr:AAA family ATPase [Alphaproteobacteria bacterium]